MSKKSWIIIAIIFMFISINMLLVAKDNGKIERLSFVTDWTYVKNKAMRDTIKIDGVLDYIGEEHVYFDSSLGSFEQFLVEEGDTIQTGDPLYTYNVAQNEDMQIYLENEQDTLKAAIKATKKAITEMKTKKINQASFQFEYPDGKKAGTYRQNITDATMMKEQFLIEKNKELTEKEAELKSIESQLRDLNEADTAITVESPYDGKITKINTALNNPLITFKSGELYVTGEISEKNRMKMSTGMAAEITLKEDGQLFEGSILELDDEANGVSPKKASAYDYIIQVDEATDENVETENEDAELLQGYHTDVTVVLREELDAITIPKQLIEDEKIWWANQDGALFHKMIHNDIEEDEIVAIQSIPIARGDFVVTKPSSQLRDRSTMITPLKPSNTSWEHILHDADKKRNIFIGLLGR